MGDTSYQLLDINKRLDSFTLALPTLEIHRGEVFALLGPTGAGKTTLLRLLAGLLPTDQGTITFDGQPFAPPRIDLPTRRRITLVDQRPLLLGGSVRMNVAYPLRCRGVRDWDHKVESLLDRLGLTDIVEQTAQTLSGGQTQLVALARAMVFQPDVLLLDEPTAHLDPARVELVEDAIQQIRQEQGATVVWATHQLFQARRIADRTALLLNGQLVEVASTEMVFNSPQDQRTADFVQGRMVY